MPWTKQTSDHLNSNYRGEMRNVGRITLMEMRTLDEMDLKGKTVFVRCDINSPIEPSSGKILDRSRPIEVSQTIKSLKSSKTVIASHQGRLGKSDYVTMEEHAAVISENLFETRVWP